MKITTPITIILMALSFTFLSCDTHINSGSYNEPYPHGCTSGSGFLVSEERIVSNFSSINLSTDGDIYLTQGDVQSLIVTTDNNLIYSLDTYIINGELIIEFDSPICKDPTLIDIHITIPYVNGLFIYGSGNIYAEGWIDTDYLNLEINGPGNIYIDDLTAYSVSSVIYGSGDIDVSGTAMAQVIDISGSGNFYGFDFFTEDTTIFIYGSGDGKVNASNILDVTINGSGNVIYDSHYPTIICTISGSGSIYPRY